MGKALALLVGLKSVDSRSYPSQDGRPWSGENGCWGCEEDVKKVDAILKGNQFETTQLLTAQATKRAVLGKISLAADRLQAGDIFVFFFSGHGGQRPDAEGLEQDGFDETICCYDGEIVDDSLRNLWRSFRRDVRIVMLSDSCHSGTNYGDDRSVEDPAMHAMLIHIGACRDDQTSEGLYNGGVFTNALVQAYREGYGIDNYRGLQQRILSITQRKTQKATYNEYGTDKVHFPTFRTQRPFDSSWPIVVTHEDFTFLPADFGLGGRLPLGGRGETPAELLTTRGTFAPPAGGPFYTAVPMPVAARSVATQVQRTRRQPGSQDQGHQDECACVIL